MIRNRPLVLCLCSIVMLLLGAGYIFAQDTVGNLDMKEVRRLASEEMTTPGTENVVDKVPVKAEKPENLVLVVLRITGYLALLIALIFVIAWTVRKWGIAGGSKIGGGSMDILEVLQLGTNRNIMMVRVLDQVLLLGQTQNQITVLEKIEGPQALEIISSSKGVVSIAKFKDVLGNFVGKMGKK